MKKISLLLFFVAGLSLVAGTGFAATEQKPAATGENSGHPCCQKAEGKPCYLKKGDAAPAKTAEQRPDVLYSCDCGGDCKCNTLSKTPGKCSCGKELRWHHVLKVEGDEAILCNCGKGCQCHLDADNPGKCSCGNAVKRVSLKGSGLYFCNCGGSCTCNTVSDQPGECRCGMQLKKG